MLSEAKKQSDRYFEELPVGTQAIIKELVKETFIHNCDVFYTELEEIECHKRDGFIPHSFNRGGIEIKGFTDLMSIWGSGNYPAHKGARKEIDRQIIEGFKDIAQNLYDDNTELAEKHGLKAEDFNYHTIQEIAETYEDFLPVLSDIESMEQEHLSGDYASIMYSIRFMYHGKVNGKHSALISAAVNTEGPYHRSHIPWAPSVFCEGAKEVEIEWTNQVELKRKLKKALETVTKEVF